MYIYLYIENTYKHKHTNYIPLPEDYTLDKDSNPRMSMYCKAPNAHDHCLLDVCKLAQLHHVNGRVGNDANVGNYACHTSFGNNVVDYLICDMWSMSRILRFEVIDLSQIISDYYMLTYKMSAKLPNVDQTEGVKTRYVWDRNLCG